MHSMNLVCNAMQPQWLFIFILFSCYLYVALLFTIFMVVVILRSTFFNVVDSLSFFFSFLFFFWWVSVLLRYVSIGKLRNNKILDVNRLYIFCRLLFSFFFLEFQYYSMLKAFFNAQYLFGYFSILFISLVAWLVSIEFFILFFFLHEDFIVIGICLLLLHCWNYIVYTPEIP